jgi:signal transduction histidine kinase
MPSQDREFPIVIATRPIDAAQRTAALFVVLLLLAGAIVVAPFANVQVGRVDAFIPALQTVLCVVELITAVFLFAQFVVQPQFAVLALASGYIFSGLFAFLQTLAFPGAYSPDGLIGDPLSSAGWLFSFWHIAFPLAAIAYGLLKDEKRSRLSDWPPRVTVGVTIVCVLTLTTALTWMATGGAGYLPYIFVDRTRQTPFTSYLTGSIWLLSVAAIGLLFIRRQTILDLWLMVALVASLPDLALSTVFTSVRFSLGWYAARSYALVASVTVLTVLLTETAFLYVRLANAITLLRRERSNRLMSLDAATGAMAHELNQPLTAISATGSTALISLRREVPNLEEVREYITEIMDLNNRAADIISSVRDLFKHHVDQRAMIHINDAARQALHLVQHDLKINDVSVSAEFRNDLPQIFADAVQLQQVILNLVRNAIDAMASTPAQYRHLALSTNLDGRSAVVLCVQDFGTGISVEYQDRVFNPFFTTKPSGMGLGLSICQTIVEGHGGKLRLVKSDASGSVFEIALPIAANNSGTPGQALFQIGRSCLGQSDLHRLRPPRTTSRPNGSAGEERNTISAK